MKHSTLLAEVALHFAPSPEDVATEGVLYVLERSGAATALLVRLAEDLTQVKGRPVTSIRSQAGSDDAARPDLELLDQSGQPVILFENKFWAGLTEAQPNTYLARLADAGGVLWFVAPEGRLPFLWPELLDRVRASDLETVQLLDSSESKAASLEGGRAIILTSWSFLLGQLQTAVDAEGSVQLSSDVHQLKGLASRMDTGGFLPFTSSDLTGPTARLVRQFCALVDGAIQVLLREPWASKKGLRASAGSGWYAQYITLHGHGCQLCFHAQMWEDHGKSPLWLRVAGPDWSYPERSEHAILSRIGPEGCVKLRNKGWKVGIWLPVMIPAGREFDDTVSGVVSRLRDVADALDGLLSEQAAVSPPPEEPLS